MLDLHSVIDYEGPSKAVVVGIRGYFDARVHREDFRDCASLPSARATSIAPIVICKKPSSIASHIGAPIEGTQ